VLFLSAAIAETRFVRTTVAATVAAAASLRTLRPRWQRLLHAAEYIAP